MSITTIHAAGIRSWHWRLIKELDVKLLYQSDDIKGKSTTKKQISKEEFNSGSFLNYCAAVHSIKIITQTVDDFQYESYILEYIDCKDFYFDETNMKYVALKLHIDYINNHRKNIPEDADHRFHEQNYVTYMTGQRRAGTTTAIKKCFDPSRDIYLGSKHYDSYMLYKGIPSELNPVVFSNDENELLKRERRVADFNLNSLHCIPDGPCNIFIDICVIGNYDDRMRYIREFLTCFYQLPIDKIMNKNIFVM